VTSIFCLVLSLVSKCTVEITLEYEVSNFLLFVVLQKLMRPHATSNSEVEKQRVAQYTPRLLARLEVPL